MGIDGAVTGDAGTGCFAKFLLGGMASFAAHGCVSAFQWEVGRGVVEQLAVELHDIGCATFVVGVAVLAVGRGCVLVATVKPARLRAIGEDVLVAIEAEFGLRLALELFVTLPAVVFQLGVPFYQWTRINELFKQGLRIAGGGKQQQEEAEQGQSPNEPGLAQSCLRNQKVWTAMTCKTVVRMRRKNSGKCSTCQSENNRS